jgi:hypothetical protein
VEIYGYYSDPIANDTDMDGLEDGFEVFVSGSSPTDMDSDDYQLSDFD